jgi:hypothetical protein
MDGVPAMHKLKVDDSILPCEGFLFLTFQRKSSIEDLVFSFFPGEKFRYRDVKIEDRFDLLNS